MIPKQKGSLSRRCWRLVDPPGRLGIRRDDFQALSNWRVLAFWAFCHSSELSLCSEHV